jgi:biotin carboxylase
MTHVVVVGGRGWVLREVLDRARRRECRVTLVQENRYVRPDHGRLAYGVCGVDSLLDVDAVEGLVRGLHERDHVDSIFSLTEYGLEAAALVGERLDIPTSSSSSLVNVLRDKGALRAALSTSPQFKVGYAVVSTAHEAEEAFNRMAGPVIVKPNSAAGSLAVAFAQTCAQVRAAFDHARLVGSSVIVEEYLDGPEFSVEAFSHAGRHLVVAITRKYKSGHFVEISHVVPGLKGPDEEIVRQYVVDFLNAIGLSDGSSHTEVIVTSRGPRIVESHNRQGGDSIPRLVLEATGVNLADFEIAARMGDSHWTLPTEVSADKAAAITFWAADRSGIVVAQPQVVSSGHDRHEITLLADVGEHVEPLLHSSDRLGWVITVGDSASEAYSRGEALVREHPFEIAECREHVHQTQQDRLRQYADEAR